jgi:hypothetical protein
MDEDERIIASILNISTPSSSTEQKKRTKRQIFTPCPDQEVLLIEKSKMPSPDTTCLYLERIEIPKEFYMNIEKCAIFGTFSIKSKKHDLFLIDLKLRDNMKFPGYQLLSDIFIYKAVPLPKRSFLWQSAYKRMYTEDLDAYSEVSLKSQKEVIQQALAKNCREGWQAISPIPCLFLANLIAGLFNAELLMILTLVTIFLVCLIISLVTNNHDRLQNYSRQFSIPFRLAWLIAQLVSPWTSSSGWGVFTVMLLDFVLIDLVFLAIDKYMGTYFKVITVLPGRVFVCEEFGYKVDENSIHKDLFMPQTSNYQLIAVVEGLLCKLTKISREEIDILYSQSNYKQPIVYSTGGTVQIKDQHINM